MDPVTRLLMQGAAGATGSAVLGVEDVFSTWLYTGNGSTQTITNGIDLSGKGGLVWTKSRNVANAHTIHDSARTLTSALLPNATNAEADQGTTGVTAFNSSGYAIGSGGRYNTSAEPYVSWTFRKAAKFFDVVTWTGSGANRTIAHNLGSVPGCIIVKRTDTTADWQVYHRSLANTEYLVLNSTAAKATGTTRWNSTTPTSTEFSLGTDATVNASGGTYVAYLFAHDAGGFGSSGNESVIKCGSYVGNGSASGPFVDLGWEPQWILVKDTSVANNWHIHDTMRGWTVADAKWLRPNTSEAEGSQDSITVSATGFRPTYLYSAWNTNGNTYIYIAIRRGPMKTPTDATKVFGLNARTGTGANATVTGGQVDDAVLIKNRGSAVGDLFAARLTGTGYLETSSTAAEIAAGTTILQANPWDVMDGVKVGTTSTITNASANTFINYLFRRAPGFFDVVAYTGTGGTQNVPHSLTVAPDFVIHKTRSDVFEWFCWHSGLGSVDKYIQLQSNAAAGSSVGLWGTGPTSSQFTVKSGLSALGRTFVVYLFATCPGVSQCFNYTGTGTTLQIDCGFASGARLVIIKRTDSTGDWYIWDSARGIISGDDPYLLLNSTAAEVANTDYIDPYSAGFEISNTAPAAINASGGSYIGLAIA